MPAHRLYPGQGPGPAARVTLDRSGHRACPSSSRVHVSWFGSGSADPPMSRVTWPRALTKPLRTIQVKCSRGVMAGRRLRASRASWANSSEVGNIFVIPPNLAERRRECKRNSARRSGGDDLKANWPAYHARYLKELNP